MKKILPIVLPVVLLFSCLEGDDLPRVEDITKGGKWTLRIGSPAEEVYAQLQALGLEKEFNDVAVAYRKPYLRPEEVRDLLPFYTGVTLQNTTGRVERAYFQFEHDNVAFIEVGGGLLTPVFQWPLDVPEGISIVTGDPIDAFYTKLLAIYQLPAYNSYTIALPNKPLAKPFDPDMANYDQWHFYFSERVRPRVSGMSSVRLYFKNGILSKIRHEYNEAEVYSDPAFN